MKNKTLLSKYGKIFLFALCLLPVSLYSQEKPDFRHVSLAKLFDKPLNIQNSSLFAELLKNINVSFIQAKWENDTVIVELSGSTSLTFLKEKIKHMSITLVYNKDSNPLGYKPTLTDVSVMFTDIHSALKAWQKLGKRFNLVPLEHSDSAFLCFAPFGHIYFHNQHIIISLPSD